MHVPLIEFRMMTPNLSIVPGTNGIHIDPVSTKRHLARTQVELLSRRDPQAGAAVARAATVDVVAR